MCWEAQRQESREKRNGRLALRWPPASRATVLWGSYNPYPYNAIKWASTICSKYGETHGKVSLAKVFRMREALPPQTLFIQMTPGDRDSDAHSEVLVYQRYVKNVAPPLQDPEILLKYPCAHHWMPLTFPWRASGKQKLYNIWMEENEHNGNLLFEDLNYKLTHKWNWFADLEMQNIKQLGIYWEK